MAEGNGENKKSSGIGELFVEFGVKGFGTMLKSLNAVSASFLLGKNAASQFAQTLTKPIKELGNTAVAVGKLSAALGTSDKNVQKLGNHFQKYGGSKEYINDLAKTQQMLYDTYRRGTRGLDAGYSLALQNAGLDPGAYRGSFDDTKRLVKDLYYATKDKSDLEANAIFRDMGWSEDWRYLFKRGGFNLNDALALPDDTIEKGQQAAENLQEFGIAMEALTNTIVGEFLPPLTKFVKWFNDFVSNIVQNKEEIKKNVKTVGGSARTPFFGVAGIVYDQYKKRQGDTTGGAADIQASLLLPSPLVEAPASLNTSAKGYKGTLPNIDTSFTPTPQDLMPSNISSIAQTNTINITNQNNINGTNAQAVADSIASINEHDLNYTRYQIDNPAQL